MNENNPQQIPVESHAKATATLGVLIIIILFVVFLFVYKPSQAPSVKENVTSALDARYFIATSDNASREKTTYTFYKASAGLAQADMTTHSFNLPGYYPTVITQSGKKNTILFKSETEKQSVIERARYFKRKNRS